MVLNSSDTVGAKFSEITISLLNKSYIQVRAMLIFGFGFTVLPIILLRQTFPTTVLIFPILNF